MSARTCECTTARVACSYTARTCRMPGHTHVAPPTQPATTASDSPSTSSVRTTDCLRCKHRRQRAQISHLGPYVSANAIFTARCYASAVLAMGLCPCLSVTSWSSTKTAKRRITQTTPHDIAQGLQFSDAKDLAISRKRCKIDACFLLKSNRKSYSLYRMVTLPMTLSAP